MRRRVLFLLLLAAGQESERTTGEYELEVAFPHLRFERPLYLTWVRDETDRLAVVEQEGVVHLFDNDPSVKETAVSIDLSAKVRRRNNEEGLLGLAFHPDFEKNRSVFLHYSASDPRRNVLSRFQMDPARRVLLADTEQVVLEVEQPYGNHNGGMIEFGPDGFLYVSLGDGGSANDPHGAGQRLDTLLAKILRLDVDKERPYAIPPDNPFAKTPGARPEIWAYGLRNVWRFSFDRATGDLWAGDVGQDLWEEIDLIVKGGNYGWNRREGTHPFGRGGEGDFREPVLDYGRREGDCVTGGYVYRGRRLPGLVGAYLYADYGSGNLWALRWDGTNVAENKLLAHGQEITAFGEDRHGEVYILSYDGRIYRLKPRGK